MRYIIAAAAVAMSAGAAQAAVVDLTYTVEAQVTDYRYDDGYYGYPYPGPHIGEIVPFVFDLQADTVERAGWTPLNTTYSYKSYENFDPETGALTFRMMPNDDDGFVFHLSNDGRGSGVRGEHCTESR